MLEGYGEGACLVCAESMWLNFLVCSQSKDLLTKSLCRQNDNMPNMPATFGLASFTQKMSNTRCLQVSKTKSTPQTAPVESQLSCYEQFGKCEKRLVAETTSCFF